MLFREPPIVEATVFATLPEAYLEPPNTEWADGQASAPRHPLLEGPVFDRDGTFYFTDIPAGRIFRVPPGGEVTLLTEYDGWPNGLKFHRDGRLFVADNKHGIMLVDPVNGRVTPYLQRAHLERFRGVNDLCFDDAGNLYFTDQGNTGLDDPTGRVFRVAADGTIQCILSNVPSPNGIVVTPDGRLLFVAAMRANSIWRVPLLKHGAPCKAGNFIQLSGGGGPDGIALMEDGGLAIAHIGLGTVWIFDAAGRPIEQVRSPAGQATTNIAFGGPDRRDLYITEAATASILVARTSGAGARLFSHS
ncbi:hypothetical protein GCM10011385_33590 [Nitratireductor aestuarii]|uniref:SMP-30/Gluconolactonase/LRE-like region domain-containing protein n=1 Tax=Nitratireductor aestuarii TaxID=1735103 RepID=A0A916W8Y1_9HYPH|nr:SMP-30/gluconolactonase/LRE family protein [Nitratireductor aestuarii]GGA76805.1 hypothetical protein GCM10011385_33590 [Nitratireductor aestuarii]